MILRVSTIQLIPKIFPGHFGKSALTGRKTDLDRMSRIG